MLHFCKLKTPSGIKMNSKTCHNCVEQCTGRDWGGVKMLSTVASKSISLQLWLQPCGAVRHGTGHPDLPCPGKHRRRKTNQKDLPQLRWFTVHRSPLRRYMLEFKSHLGPALDINQWSCRVSWSPISRRGILFENGSCGTRQGGVRICWVHCSNHVFVRTSEMNWMVTNARGETYQNIL